MILSLLKDKGIPLPTFETEDGLTAQDIMNKIRSFYHRLEKSHSEICGYAEGYFLELMANYPKSMCNRQMTETQKLLIPLIYLESKPNPTTKDKDAWPGYSYEDLSIMFDVSKATVHEAIRQKEVEAKQLLEEASLHGEAKRIAFEEL